MKISKKLQKLVLYVLENLSTYQVEEFMLQLAKGKVDYDYWISVKNEFEDEE